MIKKPAILILSTLMIAACTNNEPPNNPDVTTKLDVIDTHPDSSVVDNDTAALTGDDVNGNGIRDYIEDAIDTLEINDNQKAAVK